MYIYSFVDFNLIWHIRCVERKEMHKQFWKENLKENCMLKE
jgi:hypothetical protein